MDTRRYVVLSLTLLALVGLLAVAPAAAQGDNILHIVSFSDIRTLDPHIAYEFETWPSASLFYRGLITLSDTATPEPALADSWEVSEDGLTYTFHLRDGVMFSNGREITAEDVKYSFTRHQDPELPSPTAYMFEAIEGVEAYRNGEADEITGIQVLDDRTVQFTLTYPVSTMFQRFALPPGFIVAREGVEAAENFGREPLGAGPFVLDSWESGVRMTGSRNPNYWREGYPAVDGFVMDIGIEPSVGILRMESGEADIALDFVPNSDYPRIAADPTLTDNLVEWLAFPNTDYVTYNVNKEPFSNIQVREALDIAIDREHLVQLLNGRATVANGPIPTIVTGNNADLAPSPFDPERARALLAEAGFPDGFETTFLVSSDPQQVSIAQSIVADWANVGVEAELIAMEAAQFTDVLINQPDQVNAALTQWWMDYLDPSNIYEPLLKCGSSYNFGRFCDEELDAHFDEINLIPPGDERWAAFAELESMIRERIPDSFLYHTRTFYFKSDRLSIEADAAMLLRFDEATVQ